MATKKDLVEAYSFSRRRLVTAFVSGAPGGREVEPSRPGRAIVGGVALAVLLLAGSAIIGVFKPRSSVDWSQPALLSDSHGALYVNLGSDPAVDGPSLHQVINVTSAQLILGKAGQSVQKVSGDVLAKKEKGAPLGILDAPATVPDPGQLINTGWTACTGQGMGIRAGIYGGSHVSTGADTALLVKDEDGTHLVATSATGATVYDGDLSGAFTTALHLQATALQVPSRWTALFPTGTPIDEKGLGLSGLNTSAPASIAGQWPGQTVKVGDYFTSGSTVVMVTRSGYSEVSPFIAALLGQGVLKGPRELKGTPPSGWQLDGSTVGATDWPESVPTPVASSTDQVCAVLAKGTGGVASVRIATDPDDVVSAYDVAPHAVDPVVDAGHGAVVRSSLKGPAADSHDVDTSGTTYLVDDRAFAYRIATSTDVADLGYDGVTPVVVPPSWIGLFHTGVELSQDRALCPPGQSGGSKDGKSCS